MFIGVGEDFLACVIATIFHEYAHYFVATKLGMEVASAQMTPFGGMIEIPLSKYPWQACVAVIFAGGILNLSLAILLCGLWWFFPVTYGITYSFARANITIAMVNFLPCYPLDGGRGAYIWCKEIIKIKNAEKIISAIGVVIGVAFVSLFFFAGGNLTLLTLGVFMLLGSEKTLRQMSQISAVEKWNFANPKDKNCGVKQQNILVAAGSTEVYKIFFHLKRSGENIIKIRFENGNEISLSQFQLNERIMNFKGELYAGTTLNELFEK